MRRGAFAEGLPCCDLWLSPDHAIFADGVLIPIKHLINSLSIAQVALPEVTYYHVELERHDLLQAEGLLAESYLDTGNRAAFANGGTFVALFPDFDAASWETFACAPLIVVGRELEMIRHHVNARARA